MTKEELQEKIIRLNQSNEHYANEDKKIRQEFAKAFVWGDRRPFDRSMTYETPSWEQIFIEVGKLLAARTFYDLEGNVSQLECAVNDIKNTLNDKLPS